MAFKVVKHPASELEQAAILLSRPRGDVEAMLAPAVLGGHRVSAEEVEDFLNGVRERARQLAAARGYIEEC